MTTERKYYTHEQLERAAEQMESWRETLARDYRRELWDLAKTENFTQEALSRPERFPGEHAVGRIYIEKQIPKRRRWLNAALHVLEFGAAEMRVDFILGNNADRQRLVDWVISRDGIYDRASNRRPSVWVGMPL